MHMTGFSRSLRGLSVVAPIAAASMALNAAEQRPNIIFFLVDDYGWLDSEVAYGEEVYPNNHRVRTPNMKRLSEKGVIMTNAMRVLSLRLHGLP